MTRRAYGSVAADSSGADVGALPPVKAIDTQSGTASDAAASDGQPGHIVAPISTRAARARPLPASPACLPVT